MAKLGSLFKTAAVKSARQLSSLLGIYENSKDAANDREASFAGGAAQARAAAAAAAALRRRAPTAGPSNAMFN